MIFFILTKYVVREKYYKITKWKELFDNVKASSILQFLKEVELFFTNLSNIEVLMLNRHISSHNEILIDIPFILHNGFRNFLHFATLIGTL